MGYLKLTVLTKLRTSIALPSSISATTPPNGLILELCKTKAVVKTDIVTIAARARLIGRLRSAESVIGFRAVWVVALLRGYRHRID